MKRIKILMVDDDLDDQELFDQALKEMDVSVRIEFVCNGAEALQKLQTTLNFPDIIFCDINMPKMNGIQLLEEIKNTRVLSSIPVIIFTTSTSKIYQDQSKMLGATHYIIKPPSFTKLFEEIKNVLKLTFQSKVKGHDKTLI